MKLKINLTTTQNIETACQTASFDDILVAVNKSLEEKGLIIQSLVQKSFAGEIEVSVNALQK
jgi:hypothetical protein